MWVLRDIGKYLNPFNGEIRCRLSCQCMNTQTRSIDSRSFILRPSVHDVIRFSLQELSNNLVFILRKVQKNSWTLRSNKQKWTKAKCSHSLEEIELFFVFQNRHVRSVHLSGFNDDTHLYLYIWTSLLINIIRLVARAAAYGLLYEGKPIRRPCSIRWKEIAQVASLVWLLVCVQCTLSMQQNIRFLFDSSCVQI